MSVLIRLPRRARRLLLGANLAASLAVLTNWWLSIWPNLAASWVIGAAVAAVAVPFGAWLGRWLDQRHAGHHADTRAHVTAELAPLHRAVAELHAKLDRRQAGGAQ